MFCKRFLILGVCSKCLIKVKCNWNVNENKIKQYLFLWRKLPKEIFFEWFYNVTTINEIDTKSCYKSTCFQGLRYFWTPQ